MRNKELLMRNKIKVLINVIITIKLPQEKPMMQFKERKK